MIDLDLDRVLAWRLEQQLLDRPTGSDAVVVARRVCGLQAQVPSAADAAVAVRLAEPASGTTGAALAAGTLVRTWAMRGTLHLLATDELGDYLSLLAACRSWTTGSWQRTFATVAQIDAMADVVRDVLDGAVLSREELTAAVIARTRDEGLAEHLRSGWGAVLKPLAWQGLLINGPSDGSRVTFTSPRTIVPDWTGLPDADDAAPRVVSRYLAAHGPASPETFAAWLLRNATPKKTLRRWFESTVLDEVTVGGRPAVARPEDVDAIAGTYPSASVRLLDAFDQYVLGPGTNNPEIIDPIRRPLISKAAGWISPVLLVGGRVAGTWTVEDDTVRVTRFPEAPAVDGDRLAAEVARIGRYLGHELRVVTVDAPA